MTAQTPSPSRPSDESRVVIVTGAGKGLGRAFAQSCAQLGWKVVVNNRRKAGAPDEAGELAKAIRDEGGQAVAEYSDVVDPGAPEAIVSAATEAFGRVDAVIANAGTSGPASRLADTSLDTFREVLEVNFFSIICLVQAALPSLKASPAGRIVMVSSSAGLYGVKGRSHYAASKGALTSLSMSLAAELRRDGIGVNVLAPYAATRMTSGETAGIDTAMSPVNAAAAASWLASPQCTRTGEVWLAGGGRIRRAITQETSGATLPEGARPEDVEATAATLDGLPGLHGFPEAESAFADFFAEMKAAWKAERATT